jgi:hypothetical protein
MASSMVTAGEIGAIKIRPTNQRAKNKTVHFLMFLSLLNESVMLYFV